MEQVKQPKKKISHALMAGILIILIFLGVSLGILGSSTYRGGMMSRYEAHIESLLRLVETRIDADDLKACIENGKHSEKYDELQVLLDEIKETCDIKFIYIVKPLNTDESDNMMNVIAGVSEEERALYADMLVQLGQLTGTDYSAEVAGTYLDRMDRSDAITFYGNKTEFGDMYTGLTPLHDSNGDPVAILAVDIAIDEINQTLGKYNTITGMSVVFLALVAMVIAYLWLQHRVVQPLVKMEAAYTGFVESSRNITNPDELVIADTDIHTKDEMEALSDAFFAMSEDMKRYMKTLVSETKEKERIASELNMATRIQANMLPNHFPAFPGRKEFDLYATMHPAKEVGGDFYDFFLIDDDHLALVVADVSGKGVPAALFMMTARTIIKTKAQSNPTLSPKELLTEANTALTENNDEDMFVTVWLGVLQISTGVLTYSSAGHEKLLLYQDGTWRMLPKMGGVALAVWEPEDLEFIDETYQFQNQTIKLNPGDAIFQYTDGVTEATDANNELFGDDRLVDAMNGASSTQPEELLPQVRKKIDEFVKDAPQFDDITMLSIRYKGSQA